MSHTGRTIAFILSLLLISISSFKGAKAQAASAAGPTLTRLAAAFAGNQAISQVQLSGSATWYAGSTTDTGSVTLTATSSGSTQMQLLLAAQGARTESQSGRDASRTCFWSGADGMRHKMNLVNCWKPITWFIPALSLQPSAVSASTGIADLGVGSAGPLGVYRHLQSQFVFDDPSLTASVMQTSTMDIGLDITSFLPVVMDYSIMPDGGPQIPVSFEIRYSKYTAVNGVVIPFEIQRWVNGSLQLDIFITRAQVS